MKNISYIMAVACAIVFSSCSSLRLPSQPELLKAPETFGAASIDTATIGRFRPSDFFNDPNLVALIDTAIRNNLDIRKAYAALESASADILRAKGALLPDLTAYAGVSRRKFGLQTMDGAGNITTEIGNGELIPVHLNDFGVGLQTSWEIDIWKKLRNRKKAAVHRYLASAEGRNLLVSQIVQTTAAGYYELLALDRQLAIIDENVALNEQLLELLRYQMEAGLIDQPGVQQFEALVLNYRSDRMQVAQSVRLLENSLSRLMGRYPAPVTRSEGFGTPVYDSIRAGIPAQLLENRPDIRQAENDLAAAGADVKAARAEFFPSLAITATGGYQAYRTRFLFDSPQSIAYGIFGNLVAPLVNRSAIKAQFRQAKAAQLEAYYRYQEAILSGYVEVSNELIALESLSQMNELKRRQAALLVSSLDAANDLYNAGRANYLDVLIAQQNAILAQLELVELQKQQLITTVDLYKALGGGWR
jgi:outer membrane protein, multidrug efflux system